MKIAVVFGTRPEIIRLCRVIEKLDRASTLVLIHTGQNFEPSLSDVFFTELGVRPDIMTAMRNPFFDLKFAVTLALAISAIAVALHRGLASLTAKLKEQ